MFIVNFYPFVNLLLEFPQLHIDFFVILHIPKALAKCLFQLIKSAVRMMLYEVFTLL